jgi:hypothetical protein
MPPKPIVFQAAARAAQPSWAELAAKAPANPRPPSRARLDVLRYIDTYQRAHNYPPTLRQIAEGTGRRSWTSAHYALRRMVADGQLAPRASERELWRILVELAHE